MSLDAIIDHRRRSPDTAAESSRRVMPFYRAIMLELNRRRLALELPMDQVADRAGVADRYFSKALWADSPSGRQARWDTLQDLVDGLFPTGYDVIIKPKAGLRLGPEDLRCKIAFASAPKDPRSHRELMAALGSKGGIARREKFKTMPRKQRLAIAAKARKTRKKNRVLRSQLQRLSANSEAGCNALQKPPSQNKLKF